MRGETKAEKYLHLWRVWREATRGRPMHPMPDQSVLICESFKLNVIEHAQAGEYNPMPDDVVMLLLDEAANS
jgi:hypothetical protein